MLSDSKKHQLFSHLLNLAQDTHPLSVFKKGFFELLDALPLAHRSITCAKLRRNLSEAIPHAQHLSDCQPVRRLLLSPDFIGHGGAD